MQAKIAFSRYGHTESPVAEHLYLYQLAARTANSLLHNSLMYLLHLSKGKLPCKHHHICILGIETQRLQIGDIQLGGDMHLNSYRARI